MTRSNIALCAALAAATLTIAPTAHAQTFYQSLATFNAAATTATTYNFEGIAPTNSSATDPTVLTTPASGRVTFSVTAGGDVRVFAADSGAVGGIYRLSDASDSVLAGRPDSGASTTRINLDNTYTAFAIEYGMDSNATNSYTFTLFNNNTQVGTPFIRSSIGGDNFFGTTSTTAFNNVRVVAAAGVNGYVIFDNARTGSSTVVVPEAGTLALLLPGLAGIAGFILTKRSFATTRRRISAK